MRTAAAVGIRAFRDMFTLVFPQMAEKPPHRLRDDASG
jgi:hypothetical protein